MTLEEIYHIKCATRSDINEHLPILKEYAEKVNHVTEMGVRHIVSTYALLMGQPKKMISYDIVNIDMARIYSLQIKTDFKFVVADTTKIEIEPTDLLFIDTLHNYEQIKKELELHAPKTSQFIILHDTFTFGEKGESSPIGLNKAIQELLENKEWRIHLNLTNNNGLTILKREV